MLDKIKFRLIVIGAVIAIISLFTILLTWMGVSVWWLLSGHMVNRITFFYIYIALTTIPTIMLGVGIIKSLKNNS